MSKKRLTCLHVPLPSVLSRHKDSRACAGNGISTVGAPTEAHWVRATRCSVSPYRTAAVPSRRMLAVQCSGDTLALMSADLAIHTRTHTRTRPTASVVRRMEPMSCTLARQPMLLSSLLAPEYAKSAWVHRSVTMTGTTKARGSGRRRIDVIRNRLEQARRCELQSRPRAAYLQRNHAHRAVYSRVCTPPSSYSKVEYSVRLSHRPLTSQYTHGRPGLACKRLLSRGAFCQTRSSATPGGAWKARKRSAVARSNPATGRVSPAFAVEMHEHSRKGTAMLAPADCLCQSSMPYSIRGRLKGKQRRCLHVQRTHFLLLQCDPLNLSIRRSAFTPSIFSRYEWLRTVSRAAVLLQYSTLRCCATYAYRGRRCHSYSTEPADVPHSLDTLTYAAKPR